MTLNFGRQAVVIGAGMAGMPAARVLADHFDQVIVLENDALPTGASPRPGTPQSKHLHVLLAGGQRALSSLFPGFEQSLSAAGARLLTVSLDAEWQFPGYESFPKRDLGFKAYSMTRPLLESVVRKHFAAMGNIKTIERCRAQQLITTEDGARVTGVTCLHSDGKVEDIPTDLVIDASSNGQLTLNLLAALGLQAPKETTVGVEMGYSTTEFEIPQDAPSTWKMVLTLADPPRNRRAPCWRPSRAVVGSLVSSAVTMQSRRTMKPAFSSSRSDCARKPFTRPSKALRGAPPSRDTASRPAAGGISRTLRSSPPGSFPSATRLAGSIQSMARA